MVVSQGRARLPTQASWGRCCALLLCLLLYSASTDAQTYVRTVEIGVIPDSKQPLSPSPGSQPALAPPAIDPAPKVVGIHGQPVSFDTGHADMAHHVIVENFGGGDAGEQKAMAARQWVEKLKDESLHYKVSRAWEGSAVDAISPGTDPNVVSPSAPASSTRFFTASAGVATPEEQTHTNQQFDGRPPGGVVLEGAFDPGTLQSVVYDARFHALVLDTPGGGRVAYFSIPAGDVVTLCHAINGDERMRVAVSLVHPPSAYGALRPRSNLALNMFVADGFLGAIAFGSLTDAHDMIAGFRLAGDYAPQKPGKGFAAEVVTFTFRTDDYQDDGKSLTPSGNALDVRFMPLAASGAAALTDDVPGEFVENAKHITDNLDYYREEPIVTQIFRYAQTASLLRGLKQENVDLDQLADGIAFATGAPK